jgi:hypothetical protein
LVNITYGYSRDTIYRVLVCGNAYLLSAPTAIFGLLISGIAFLRDTNNDNLLQVYYNNGAEMGIYYQIIRTYQSDQITVFVDIRLAKDGLYLGFVQY